MKLLMTCRFTVAGRINSRETICWFVIALKIPLSTCIPVTQCARESAHISVSLIGGRCASWRRPPCDLSRNFPQPTRNTTSRCVASWRCAAGCRRHAIENPGRMRRVVCIPRLRTRCFAETGSRAPPRRSTGTSATDVVLRVAFRHGIGRPNSAYPRASRLLRE